MEQGLGYFNTLQGIYFVEWSREVTGTTLRTLSPSRGPGARKVGFSVSRGRVAMRGAATGRL